MRRSHILLVLGSEINTFLQQEVDHVVLIILDGVVNWSLVLGVSDIVIGPIFNQELGHPYQTLSCTVVDGSLAILVLPVQVSSLLNEQLHKLLIALPCSIEQRTLLEKVLLDRIHTHINQHVKHLQSRFMVLNDCCVENGGLREISWLILQICYVN